jgi:hypothetical protein
MARMLGGNWARFAGLETWSEAETVAVMGEWEHRWRQILRGRGPDDDTA